MTLVPCSIPRRTVHRNSYVAHAVNQFLTLNLPCVKVTELGNRNIHSAYYAFTRYGKKNNLPIKASTCRGSLYLINTSQVTEG